MAGEDMVKNPNEELRLETLGGDVDIDIPDRAAKEKALLRRIDKRMMPLMMLLCEYDLFVAAFHDDLAWG